MTAFEKGIKLVTKAKEEDKKKKNYEKAFEFLHSLANMKEYFFHFLEHESLSLKARRSIQIYSRQFSETSLKLKQYLEEKQKNRGKKGIKQVTKAKEEDKKKNYEEAFGLALFQSFAQEHEHFLLAIEHESLGHFTKQKMGLYIVSFEQTSIVLKKCLKEKQNRIIKDTEGILTSKNSGISSDSDDGSESSSSDSDDDSDGNSSDSDDDSDGNCKDSETNKLTHQLEATTLPDAADDEPEPSAPPLELMHEDSNSRDEVQNVKENFWNLLEDELICNICAELLIKPTTLGCSHTFCKYCITQWKEEKNRCPQCQTRIKSEAPCLSLEKFLNKAVMQLDPEKLEKRLKTIRCREQRLKE